MESTIKNQKPLKKYLKIEKIKDQRRYGRMERTLIHEPKTLKKIHLKTEKIKKMRRKLKKCGPSSGKQWSLAKKRGKKAGSNGEKEARVC